MYVPLQMNCIHVLSSYENMERRTIVRKLSKEIICASVEHGDRNSIEKSGNILASALNHLYLFDIVQLSLWYRCWDTWMINIYFTWTNVV